MIEIHCCYNIWLHEVFTVVKPKLDLCRGKLLIFCTALNLAHPCLRYFRREGQTRERYGVLVGFAVMSVASSGNYTVYNVNMNLHTDIPTVLSTTLDTSSRLLDQVCLS